MLTNVTECVIFVSATDEDFYSSLAQMAGDGFDDDDDPDEVIILVELLLHLVLLKSKVPPSPETRVSSRETRPLYPKMRLWFCKSTE